MAGETYWICLCGEVAKAPREPGHNAHHPCTWKPVAVLPVEELASLRARCKTLEDSLGKCIDQLQKQYDNEECECPPEGHMCGRDRRGWELKAARAALRRETP